MVLLPGRIRVGCVSAVVSSSDDGLALSADRIWISVPVLLTLTDRIDAKRVYLFGVGCTLVAHLAFGLLADGFWSAMALR